MAAKRAGKRADRKGRKSADLAVTAGAFADIVGVHHNTVGAWLKEGLPAVRLKRQTRIEVTAGVLWVRARDRREHEAELERIREDRNAEASRAAKVAAEARLKELDLAEREGRLILADDVEARWSQILLSIREAVMGIPGSLVQAGVVEPAAEAAVEAVCRDTLVGIAASDEPVAAVAVA